MLSNLVRAIFQHQVSTATRYRVGLHPAHVPYPPLLSSLTSVLSHRPMSDTLTLSVSIHRQSVSCPVVDSGVCVCVCVCVL